MPSDIDPSLCTHIVYGFAVLDNNELVVRAHDSWADFDNCTYTLASSAGGVCGGVLLNESFFDVFDSFPESEGKNLREFELKPGRMSFDK